MTIAAPVRRRGDVYSIQHSGPPTLRGRANRGFELQERSALSGSPPSSKRVAQITGFVNSHNKRNAPVCSSAAQTGLLVSLSLIGYGGVTYAVVSYGRVSVRSHPLSGASP